MNTRKKHPICSRHAHPAFSLTEIILVTVIISIIATIAAPRMEGFNNNQAINALTRKISLDFALARSEAIKRRANVTVSFDTTGQFYEFVGITDITRPDGTTGNYRVNLGEEHGFRARIKIVEFGLAKVQSVTFDAFGRADNTGGVLVVCGDTSSAVVMDQASGTPAVTDTGTYDSVILADPFGIAANNAQQSP